MSVAYTRMGDVVAGREQNLQSRECMILRLKASENRIADKEFLREWLLFCVECYRAPRKMSWRYLLSIKQVQIGFPCGRSDV